MSSLGANLLLSAACVHACLYCRAHRGRTRVNAMRCAVGSRSGDFAIRVHVPDSLRMHATAQVSKPNVTIKAEPGTKELQPASNRCYTNNTSVRKPRYFLLPRFSFFLFFWGVQYIQKKRPFSPSVFLAADESANRVARFDDDMISVSNPRMTHTCMHACAHTRAHT